MFVAKAVAVKVLMAIIASLSDKKFKQLCENDTKIMFSSGC